MSCARAPPSCIRPSGPRTTEGSSGSDSLAFSRDEGSRDTFVAVSVLPSTAAVGDEGAIVVAVTVVVSVALAMDRVITAAPSRGTRAGSKPSSVAVMVVPRVPGGMTNVPSGPDVSVATTFVPSRIWMVTPGSGRPV